MHFGLGPGDEVIVPALTHVATAHAVEITGARPVFVDADVSGNLDLDALATAITPRTRAICVVHYPGLPVDMPVVMDIAHRHDLKVVEDCALALGGYVDGTHCGLFGDVASFSFYPAKHMTTGEGGMVVSKDEATIASISNIKAFGYDRGLAERSVPGVYDIARLGLNYRMGEMSAAIGIQQLKKVPAFLSVRRANMDRLRNALAGVDSVSLLPDGDGRRVHANYCLVAQLDGPLASRRNDILTSLKAQGVGASVYYPVPLPLSTYYRERYGARAEEFPRAWSIANESMALPVGPHLTVNDMDMVATAVAKAVKGD
jgi:dTDP-4-amino-4,6-dideoxygalactose transaminase